MDGVDNQTVSRLAAICTAVGAEPRLRILRLLLSAQPGGMFVGAIQDELGITGPTLSHHLDKLRTAGLVTVQRERQFLWYSANSESLSQLLAFLMAEGRTRNHVVDTASILSAAGTTQTARLRTIR